MRIYFTILTCFFFLYVNAQILVDGNLCDGSTIRVALNQTVTFTNIDGDCANGFIALEQLDGEMDQVSLFTPDSPINSEVNYTFTTLGNYAIVCSIVLPTDGGIDGPNACNFEVVESTTGTNAQVVPTLSQWSIILLALLLFITGALHIRRKAVTKNQFA